VSKEKNYRRIFNIDVKNIADKDIGYFMENLKKSLKIPPTRLAGTTVGWVNMPWGNDIEFHEARYRVNLEAGNYYASTLHLKQVIRMREENILKYHCT
jgi:hypothetical protein